MSYPTPFLIAAVPALAEASAEVATCQTAHAAANREHSAASKALRAIALRDSSGGWTVPKAGVLAADVDAARMTVDAAKRAQAAAQHHLSLAQRAFEGRVEETLRSGELRRVAAERALELTDRAATLWADAAAILDERDATVAAARGLGRSWTTTRGANIHEADGGAGAASRIITARIDGFDRAAAEAVAAGETPASARPRPVDGYRAGFDALAPTDEHGRSAR